MLNDNGERKKVIQKNKKLEKTHAFVDADDL